MSAYFKSQDKTVHKDGIAPNIAVKEELDLDHLLTGKTIDSAKEWIEQAE
jgi:C-terminal processing protease CtpA/Prc